MKKKICLLLFIVFFLLLFGCGSSQLEEENTRLNNVISVQEKEIESLHAEIRELETALYESQNKNFNKITDEDFRFLLQNYEAVNYEIYNISDEIGSIIFRLEEYADTQDEKDKVIRELYELQDETYTFAEKAGDIISCYL